MGIPKKEYRYQLSGSVFKIALHHYYHNLLKATALQEDVVQDNDQKIRIDNG